MSATPQITTERVDDVPLLLAHMERMSIPALLTRHFPTHGNWMGSSIGWTTALWLSHLLSEADHRMQHVQAWAERRLLTLTTCTQQPVRALDVSDDRLAAVLEALSDDARWMAFEAALTSGLIRVYDLATERVRVDSTAISSYGQVSEDGLLQFGHSKDHRPDLPQVKVQVAALDPMGLPLATEVVAGNQADDPLYLPAINRVRASLNRRGVLYIGDCKMGAVTTRATLQAGDDFYLCPLAGVQLPEALLATYVQPVTDGNQSVIAVTRVAADGSQHVVAEGYECSARVSAEGGGQSVTWTERRLVVRSLAQAQASAAGLRQRLAQAQAVLDDLLVRRRGKPVLTERTSVEQASAAILMQYRVQAIIEVTITEQVQERTVRGYRGQPDRSAPGVSFSLSWRVNAAALERTIAQSGWRVYATNHPAATLTLEQAVLAYRDQYLIERDMARLKGHPLSLRPLTLTRDDHIVGMVRLLTIALRVLTLLEYVVRCQLAQEQTSLVGGYAGQPKRGTARPTAEHLLTAFKEITLTVIAMTTMHVRHVTPLSIVQQRIITLVGLDPNIYTRLGQQVVNPPDI